MPVYLAVIAGLALAAAGGAVFGVLNGNNAAGAGAPVEAARTLPPVDRPKPPIDATQPSEIETATFGMG